MLNMNKVLLIDKEAGKTSYKATEEVKRLFKIKKAGHSGTLDRSASGLLIVCTGWATKLTRYFLDSDKRYIGVVKLGITTDTGDSEGRIVRRQNYHGLCYDRVYQIKKRFSGEITQLPHQYSALKIGGKRASDLVRQGEEVFLQKRKVIIRRFDILNLDLENALITIDVICSKGTYIRSLARDIGEYLETGAYLLKLRRVASGSFTIENAVTLGELREHIGGKDTEKVYCYRPIDALSDFGSIVIDNNSISKVLNGAFFKREDVIRMKIAEEKPYIIIDEEENLFAIADVDIRNWIIKYLNVFNRK